MNKILTTSIPILTVIITSILTILISNLSNITFLHNNLALINIGYANEPISVIAQHQSIDTKTNTSIFNGNVIITQGDLIIKANQAVINKLNQTETLLRLSGSPVVINKKSSNLAIESATAIYNSETQVLILTNATINIDNSFITGDKIEYSIKTGEIKASSSKGVKTIFDGGNK